MSLFPVFLKLKGRPCLVVGAGPIGEAKARGLLERGASVRVVAPKATETVRRWAKKGRVAWLPRAYKPSDLAGIFLAVVATSSRITNERVYREATRRRVLCNVVDDPEHCDFYYGAVVRRGPLQIAISTSGRSPALAQRLKRELEERFGPEIASWVEWLGREREKLRTSAMDAEHRRQLLHRLANRREWAGFARKKSTKR